MRIGDTLICKKELIFKYCHIKKHNNYIINGADGYYVSVDIEDSGLCFYLDKDNQYYIDDILYLFDYFYTQDELRLKKLESL